MARVFSKRSIQLLMSLVPSPGLLVVEAGGGSAITIARPDEGRLSVRKLN